MPVKVDDNSKDIYNLAENRKYKQPYKQRASADVAELIPAFGTDRPDHHLPLPIHHTFCVLNSNKFYGKNRYVPGPDMRMKRLGNHYGPSPSPVWTESITKKLTL